MKTLFLASALALSVGMSAALASVITYTDGSIYNSDAVAAIASKNDASGMRLGIANPTTWHKTGMKVVRFGPPETGAGTG